MADAQCSCGALTLALQGEPRLVVAVGAMSDHAYPAPARSIFERSKLDWLRIDGVVEHFPESSASK